MRLNSVKIENYRGIESLEFPLDPDMTVLHGPNGCGKTSVLTAVMMALSGDRSRPEFQRIKLDRPAIPSAEPSIQLNLGPSPGRESLDEPVSVSLFAHPLDPALPGGPWHREVTPEYSLPRFSFYDIERRVVSSLDGREVGSQPDYAQLFEWFLAEESKEFRLGREKGREVRLPSLSAVRDAVCRMLDGVSNPRIVDVTPLPRLVVSVKEADTTRNLAFEQLSDGYRGVMAVAADIAARMAALPALPENPIGRRDDRPHRRSRTPPPPGLAAADPDRPQTRTFANAQFIVSTHSPQVLTTVHPKHIVELEFEGGRVVAGGPPAPTYGAEAGDVLSGVMGVEKRPDNEFSAGLRDYMRLVGDDEGETAQALELRRQLEELSFHDPALQRADLEIRRRKMLRDMGES